MTFEMFSLQDWLTIILLIAQAGIVYHRLKKVEEVTEKFIELTLTFAVLKNTVEHHKKEFESFSRRTERTFQKMDERLSGIESHTLKSLINYDA